VKREKSNVNNSNNGRNSSSTSLRKDSAMKKGIEVSSFVAPEDLKTKRVKGTREIGIVNKLRTEND
jgi:hypothetical protein